MGEVRVLIPELCEECNKVRKRHRDRLIILMWLKDKGFPVSKDDIKRLNELSQWGQCYLHRHYTVDPTSTWKKDAFFDGHKLIFEWWSNYHNYRAEITDVDVNVYKDDDNIFWSGDVKVVRQTLYDALMLSNSEMLDKLLNAVVEKEIVTDGERKAAELIIARAIWNGERRRNELVVDLRCDDKPITQVLQGIYKYPKYNVRIIKNKYNVRIVPM